MTYCSPSNCLKWSWRKRKEDSESKRETENNNETVSSLSSVGNRGSEELGIFGLSHPGLHRLASCL